MKIVGLSLFIGLALAAPAAMAIQPQDICGLVNCSEPMKAIASEFTDKTGPVTIDKGTVASGVCYYISGSTTADYAHAGLGVFTPNLGKTEYRGVFSFFGKPADYAALAYDEAYKKVASDRPAPTLIDGPKYSGYLLTNDDTHFSYWFGMNAEKTEVNLISLWLFSGSIGQVAFCKMQTR